MIKYVIITPANNEENYIKFTLDSVVAQSIHPEQWIIVDDGSTDNTGKIIQEYAKMYNWIKYVKNYPEDKNRKGGGKVIRAFNCGYAAVDNKEFQFIVKLDADLTLPSNYFEEVGRCFASNPIVGLCGGILTIQSKGKWQKEPNASYHLRGAIKAYRKECFLQIGGLDETLHWDFLDEMKAMSRGWQIKILPLEVRHHRKTSTSINKGLRNSFIIGKQHYKHGYDLFLAFFRSITFGFRTRPLILSSLAFLSGFIYCCVMDPKKEVDSALEKFIRKFQYTRIKMLLKRLLRIYIAD